MNQASECCQDFHPHHFACIDAIHESAAYRSKDCLFVLFNLIIFFFRFTSIKFLFETIPNTNMKMEDGKLTIRKSVEKWTMDKWVCERVSECM